MTWEEIIKIQTEQDKQELQFILNDTIQDIEGNITQLQNTDKTYSNKIHSLKLSHYKEIFEKIKTLLQM